MEYITESCSAGYEIAGYINQAVKNGWEFVQVITEPQNGAHSVRHYILFRRPIKK